MAWSRPLVAVAVLGLLGHQLGAGPFLDGLRAVSGWSLVVAVVLALLTTVCAAWRWRAVASGLGVGLPLAAATAACYRSQFLNTVLPGGVLGDLHRAVQHGRGAGDLSHGLRAVAWERSAGQALQVVLTLVVLSVLPSPVRPFVPPVVAVLLMTLLTALLASRLRDGRAGGGRELGSRVLRAATADVRDGLLARRAWPAVTVASLVVIAGHTTTFLVAARTAGVAAPVETLLPLVLLVMLAMALPVNLGGWGPREGAAAWLFGLAGLGAGQGVAAATVYGVMAMVGTLPGAVVLLVSLASRRHPPHPVAAPRAPEGSDGLVAARSGSGAVPGG